MLHADKFQEILDWSYAKAIDGLPGLDSVEELCKSYQSKNLDISRQVDNLIKWQIAKATSSGFISSIGGLPLMPVTLPANITSVLYIQIRMIASIAHLNGHDLKSDKIKTLVFCSLLGNAGVELLKNTGIQIGKKIAEQSLKNMSGKILIDINKKVGFRLFTKFGEKGIINFGKAIPLLGGVIGGTCDCLSTKLIAKTAKNVFIETIDIDIVDNTCFDFNEVYKKESEMSVITIFFKKMMVADGIVDVSELKTFFNIMEKRYLINKEESQLLLSNTELNISLEDLYLDAKRIFTNEERKELVLFLAEIANSDLSLHPKEELLLKEITFNLLKS